MSDIGAQFLAHHLAFHPVNGSFMGLREHDARLPRADRQAAADEARAIESLCAAAAAAPERDAGERLDKRIAQAELRLAAAALRERPRFSNPSWYTGESIFGIVSLLLPQSLPLDAEAVTARLGALPDFLADGLARLREAGAVPAGWRARAAREAEALAQFLREDLGAVPDAPAGWQTAAAPAANALAAFVQGLGSLAGSDPAAGRPHLEQVMREVHGLQTGADELLAAATAAFHRLGEELVADAQRLTPGQTWAAAIASLGGITPPADDVLGAYRAWHASAADTADAGGLVTPARDYALDYRWMAPAFRRLAASSYFLYYRCPPVYRPGAGSVYWVNAPGDDREAFLRSQSIATLKTTHTVHHGSIGHHTQNAHARRAPGTLARVAGTDCSSGIALLSAGTMVEGWACYAEDLLREAGGFYSPAEQLLLKQNERRNAASVMVDIRLHTGEWSLGQAAAFYRDEAGFPAARVEAETVRNSMFPGSRLMYWAGVEAIKSLRRASPLSARAFHDRLLSFGHVPIAAAAAEMARGDRPA